ncbi:MAG TPA: heparan-alpha-glucosaminide N-acetyltransferase domain-containing protein [Chryseolinea sp.]
MTHVPNFSFPFHGPPINSRPVVRIRSIDLLRGLALVIMTLDHVWNYFDVSHFSSTDFFFKATSLRFGVHWISHLCAPVFVLLAGTSAYLYSTKNGRPATSKFLLIRGVFLLVLQSTLIKFGWTFDASFHYQEFDIISIIGICLIILAGMIYLPMKLIIFLAIAILCGHNALDGVSFAHHGVGNFVWSILHRQETYVFGDGYVWNITCPLIPWIGVIALGYCAGPLYAKRFPAQRRRRILFFAGLALLFAFLLLRWINGYGDPVRWTDKGVNGHIFLSFLNLHEYPPSLIYLCTTLGVIFLLLDRFEDEVAPIMKPLEVFGRVALFYYLVHIYLTHVLAMGAAMVFGFPLQALTFGDQMATNAVLEEWYGVNLSVVYLIWVLVIISLYWPCKWFGNVKQKNQSWKWLRYV